MGIFSAVKRFFRGTRKADHVRLFNTISPEPKRSSPAKRVSSAQRKAQTRKTGEVLKQAMQHSRKETERIRAGEALAAATRKKQSNAHFDAIWKNLERNKKEAARARPTNTWNRAFAASLNRIQKGEKPRSLAAYAAKGNVKKPGATTNRSVGAKSIRVRDRNWEQIPVNRTNRYGFGSPAAIAAAFGEGKPASLAAPSKGAKAKTPYTRKQIEENLAGLFNKQPKRLRSPPKGPAPKRAAAAEDSAFVI